MANDGGYLSQACSAAELLATLYTVANLAPLAAPKFPEPFHQVPGKDAIYLNGGDFHGEIGPERDRIVISPAHYALVVYAALIETGRLDASALDQFNQDGSTVEMIGAEHSPGMAVTSGSLGIALGVACGRAIARRQQGKPGDIWVLISDGELQEGSTWEALQLAVAQNLGNLRIVLDRNNMQVDGNMATVMPIGDAGRET